ncbi:VOC family protein [Pseudalkalibacillus hwajinpoensis]|uniref:VOC family protein n=1 Tax=Guptibacillus hwajinpoensis TaxID=208199 RepID=UPI00325B65C7
MFRVGSVFIPVTDIGKSSEWYEYNLGVKKIQGWGEGIGSGEGFYFPDSPTQFGLVQVEEAQPTEFVIKGDQRNGYFNFVVDDIHEVHNQLKENGVRTTELEDFGGMTCFDFFDPDGNPLSVVTEVRDSPFHSEQVKKRQREGR